MEIDYFPLRIRVFRNGDIYNVGHVMAVTRKQFKHWIVFLDSLTVLLHTPTAVRRLFTVNGLQVNHFDELETNGEYVAVENGPFINVPYGQTRFTMRGKRYNPIIRIPELTPTFLNSAESMDIYLKKEGYGTITGLPYPFDGVLTRSPSASHLHIQSHNQHRRVPPLKIGGSAEHLNEMISTTANWVGDNQQWLETKRTTKLPRLINSTSSSVRKEKPVTNAECVERLPPIETSAGKERVVEVRLKSPAKVVEEEQITQPVRSSYQRTYQLTEMVIESQPAVDGNRKKWKDLDEVENVNDGEEGEKQGDVQKITTTASDSTSTERRKESEDFRNTEATTVKQESPNNTEVMKSKSGNSNAVKSGRKIEKKEEARASKTNGRTFTDSRPPIIRKRVEPKPENLTTTPNSPISRSSHGEPMKKVGNGTVVRTENEGAESEKRSQDYDDDVDINVIPKRMDSKIVTSRSNLHTFVDEIIGEQIDDVLERAKLWEQNRKRQNTRAQFTQTSGRANRRSKSAPRRPIIQLFDPDFD